MEKKKFVTLTLALSDLPHLKNGRLDVSQNVRGDDDPQIFEYEYGNLALLGESMLPLSDDGLLLGQHVPIVVNRKNGKIDTIIDGNRRALAAEIIGAKQVKAIAYDDLSDEEIAKMRAEHSTQKAISKIGLFRTIAQMLQLGKPGIEVVNTPAVLNAFQTLHPPKKDNDGKPISGKGAQIVVPASPTLTRQNWFDRYRGLFQGYEDIFRNGKPVEVAWSRKVAGLQNWPDSKEINTLSKIFIEEASANPKVTRDNPGPEWRKKWQQVSTTAEEGAKDGQGGNKPKSTAVMSAKDMAGVSERAQSVTVKTIVAYIRRLPNDTGGTMIDDATFVEVDKLLAEIADSAIIKLLGKAEASLVAGASKAEQPAPKAEQPVSKAEQPASKRQLAASAKGR